MTLRRKGLFTPSGEMFSSAGWGGVNVTVWTVFTYLCLFVITLSIL